MRYEYPSMMILGATGSVGKQAVDVARKHNVRVDAVSANKSVLETEDIVRMLQPRACAMADEQSARDLAVRIADLPVRVYSGAQGICEMIAQTNAEGDKQVVLNSILGQAGLAPTLATLEAGKQLALANKESLVVAGEIVMPLAAQKGIDILPVDSEHCAIYQCLRSGNKKEIKRIMLTASGGPFYGYTRQQLEHVTKQSTLAHPTWNMGAKITVDSATMMNKGFEVIEAVHLFGVRPEQVEVTVHRESIIHSAVEYIDNNVIAQLSVPDMRSCVQYALTYPVRSEASIEQLDWFSVGRLTFGRPDMQTFSLLRLAFECIQKGGALPAVLNAANEVCVEAFLQEKLSFCGVMDTVEQVVTDMQSVACMHSLEQILESDLYARELARQHLKKM
ncbi:MAG: 1-deoxy-D-xylulose-5-phosphate reductoisomerase [Clostridia bacterium]|nr:1-deoxy-D-xylulose-5-phosphate reductoisomerase [Clostridia bacterium]